MDDDNTRVDLNDKDGIWQRCLRLCPSLAVSGNLNVEIQCKVLFDF